MPLVAIESLTDPRLDPYRHLKDTNGTRWAGQFIVEGDKLVARLLASDFETVSLLLGARWVGQFDTRVAPDVPVFVVADDWIPKIVGFNFHRGALACARRKPDASLDSLCERAAGRLTLAVCPDVQNPENLGAIARLASALGIDGVVLGERSADPFSRRVLRVSMGAVLQMPIVQSTDVLSTLVRLRDHWNVETWASVLDPSAQPLRELARPNRLAVVLGSEGHGLEPRIIQACNRRVTIPMRPGVDSLNVAVAAGIFLYQVMSDRE